MVNLNQIFKKFMNYIRTFAKIFKSEKIVKNIKTILVISLLPIEFIFVIYLTLISFTSFYFTVILESVKSQNNTLIALILSSFTIPSLLHMLSRDERFDEIEKSIKTTFFVLIPFSILSGLLMSSGLILPHVIGHDQTNVTGSLLIMFMLGLVVFIFICVHITVIFLFLLPLLSVLKKDTNTTV
ncbi:MAG: hypothetical protein QW409_02450 [Candidatus Aenigmatarchaeota archaeon]